MNRLLLIDGHSILSRAYYGIPLLSASSGIHTNAVYGFLNIMFKCIDDEKADYIAVAFDLERSRLRRVELYPEYKGTRKPMPTELLEQVPIIQELLSLMNVPILTLTGYEADDILGTIAKRAQRDGMEVTIVSGDRDLLQLCDEHIKVAMPKTSRGRTEVFNYYPDDVKAQYSVTPSEFIDLKALMGDSSDNIPGLPGVGEKTATEIIVKYGSIENAHEHADEVRPPRASRALKESFALAELSKTLATIDINAPVELDIKNAGVSAIYTPNVLGRLRELELKSLVARFTKYINERGAAAAGKIGVDAGTATGGDGAGQTGDGYAAAKAGTNAGLDLSTVKSVSDPFMAGVAYKDALASESALGLYFAYEPAFGGDWACAALALGTDRCFCITSGDGYKAGQLKDDIESLVNKLIEKKSRIVTLGLKDELKHLDIPKNHYIDDYTIAQYLIDPVRNSYDYDDLARDMLGIITEGRQELTGKKSLRELSESPDDAGKAVKIMAMCALVPLMAEKRVEAALEENGLAKLFRDVEMPLVYTLNDMEKAGIAVDRSELSALAASFKREIDSLSAEICDMAGEIFNINSPQQLGMILFEKLGIPGGKKTKKGYSTAADVLEKVRDRHPIVDKVLRYRAITKLYSTYAAGLDEFIAEDGRIHGTFNQTITATGRISSTDPNLQNIPVRTAEGKELRRVFVPKDGFVFVDADYSQVELRILAALSGDTALIKAYENAVDVHTLTASQVFGVPVEDVTPEMRRNAKAVNFGIVYGISAFGLGEGLSIGRKEAAEYIEQYFKSYPKVKEYLDGCVESAKRDGYVKTHFGRIRPVPELKSSNYMQRSFGERIAMNSPIQGTAADIMKIAMNRVHDALLDGGFKSRIVLQVHDELLIETAADETDRVKNLVKECMEGAARLPVALSVDVKTGGSWYECH